MLKPLTLALCFLLFSAISFAEPITQTVTYRVAADDDAWQLSSSPFGCRLSVAVAGAGLLQLELLPGQHSNLSLISSWLNQAHSVNASVGYPAWGEGFPGKLQSRQMQWQTGKASLRSGELGVFIKGLEQGWRWTFELGQSDGFLLEVDTLSARSQLQPLRQCRQQLLPQDYDYVHDLSIFYPSGIAGMDSSMQADIQAVARYVAVDRNIKKILIDGHADDGSSRLADLVLSKDRVENVVAALVELGVKRQMIEARHHGNRQPYSKEQSEVNRRVRIRLVKAV
ncbi:OmpA family protein [Shewanella algae]|uniref:MotY family protein n=1 Tax=Shewanella algae TaxID=38313 RepID=UPI00313BA4A4